MVPWQLGLIGTAINLHTGAKSESEPQPEVMVDLLQPLNYCRDPVSKSVVQCMTWLGMSQLW